MGPLTEDEILEREIEIVNPHPTPSLGDRKTVYYVSEADLYSGVMELYETGEFPEKLAEDLLKMCRRIVTSRRFFAYPDILKEEMVSCSSCKVCRMLQLHKYDPKRGSKVYSWASRVILNECLQVISREDVRTRRMAKYVEEVKTRGEFERVEVPMVDQY